jgi:hypothetical protein
MNELKQNGITLTLLVWIDNGQFVLASDEGIILN